MLESAILDCSVPVQITRFLPPAVIKGRVQGKPIEDVFSVMASPQPMTAKDLQRLPEGMRADGSMVFFTVDRLHTVNTPECDHPDHIDYRGVTYRVDIVEDWFDLGGYFKVIAARLTR